MKILLAVDGSAPSDEAVNEVARRPWPADSTVKVLSVVEPLSIPATENWVAPDNYYQDLLQAGRNQAQAVIDKAVKLLRAGEGASLEIITEVLEGPPKSVILDEAEAWGADLIVLGSRGLGAFQRFLLGSVSHAVASHAKCSVEIVRGRESSESGANDG
jgi:nucleotide-binding universal stress UspA family protein